MEYENISRHPVDVIRIVNLKLFFNNRIETKTVKMQD